MASGPRLLGIIALVVIAGCSSVTGGDDPAPVTVTPAEVPEVTSEPEATANTIPHPMAEDVEEEKRLFYVALSRARERSYISYHGTPSEFLEYL